MVRKDDSYRSDAYKRKTQQQHKKLIADVAKFFYSLIIQRVLHLNKVLARGMLRVRFDRHLTPNFTRGNQKQKGNVKIRMM